MGYNTEPTNRELASVNGATSLHTGKNIANRSMVGNKSRAGAVRRRNHFLYTEPTGDAMPRSAARTHGVYQYHVMGKGRKGKHLMTFGSLTQAQSYAISMGGRVEIG